MAYELDGRSLTPLSELVQLEDLPFAEFVPLSALDNVFYGLYYTEASSYPDEFNLVIDLRLAWEGSLALSPPGCDSYSLTLGSAGSGWTSVEATFTIGPQLGAQLYDVPLGLRFDPAVLRDVQSGDAAEVTVQGDLILSVKDGISLENFAGGSLDPAYLCGTQVVVAAQDARPVFGPIDPPPFLADHPHFEGLAIEKLTVTLPSELLHTDPGADLTVEMQEAAIGTTGFSGKVSLDPDPQNPITGKFLDFPFRFQGFSVNVAENALIDVSLSADLRIEALEEQGNPKWVRFDVAFDANGGLSAALAAVQPPEASNDPADLVRFEYPNVALVRVRGARLSLVQGVFAAFFSGSLELGIDGAEWPEIEFDEIGANAHGDILLPDGAGVTFEKPLVTDWHFARLAISKFRFGRVEGSQSKLQIALAAEVVLVEGIPAGASVKGLSIEWDLAAGVPPDVRFEGIGIQFGVPGAFAASVELEYLEQNGVVEFRGRGFLALTALDMKIEIGVVVGYDQPEDFSFLYLFADAKLLPTGIPIAATGLSIYGLQGLVASNMGLDIDLALPPDERFYQVFARNPIGITHMSKWVRKKGHNALGVGVVLGTADKGFVLNVKGLLVVAFPDLTLLLQCKANFLKTKPDLSTDSEGTLDALLVYASGESSLSIDVVARWGMPKLFEVTGAARAYFEFDNPHAWYIQIGTDAQGKRVSAKALQWQNKWLFTAGFWMKIDENGFVTGIVVDVGLRKSKAGFWIEVRGGGRAEMALFWEPAQWEGSLELWGRITAGYRGLSVGISLSGYASARVYRPTGVRLRAEACFKALFWKVCKGHTFKWNKLDPPILELPFREWSATPRHWTAEVKDAPPPGGGSAALETGRVLLDVGGGSVVQPHSELLLNFAKPMVDGTAQFNEAVALAADGFLKVGEHSDYAARYQVMEVRLMRNPGGAAEAVPVWGTWEQRHPHYNTSLRLWSSKRFGHDGSLSGGFAEDLDLDYCAEPDETERCLPLDGAQPGSGQLADGVYYQWNTGENPGPRDGDGGVVLLPGDMMWVCFTREVDGVHFDFESVERSQKLRSSALRKAAAAALALELPRARHLAASAAVAGVAALSAFVATGSGSVLGASIVGGLSLVAALVLLQAWLRRAREKTGAAPSQTAPTRKHATRSSDNAKTANALRSNDGPPADGRLYCHQVPYEGGTRVTNVCWRSDDAPIDWTVGTRRGGSLTDQEEWTVPADQKLLQPNSTYMLEVDYDLELRAPNGSISHPHGAPTTRTVAFQTSGPPLYPGSLANYVAELVPSSGARPVYTGYDIRVAYHDDYVPFLYTSVGSELSIRLIDAQGKPVEDADGNPTLLPTSKPGSVTRTQTELKWEAIYEENRERGCIKRPPIVNERTTVHVIVPGASALQRNSQYRAQLVSSQHPDVPLHEWGFKTSSFATFTDQVAEPRLLPPKRAQGVTPANGDFETLARTWGVSTVNYVDHFTVTPIRDAADERCVAVLLESPEPLGALYRLSVVLDRANTRLAVNLDETRVFALHGEGADWSTDVLTLHLTWARDVGATLPRLEVAGDATSEQVEFEVAT